MAHYHFWNVNRDGRDRIATRSLAYHDRANAYRAARNLEPDSDYRLGVKPCSRKCKFAPRVRRP